FLSTRRGQAVRCGRESAEATVKDPYLPDSYVRCGGGKSRPVAVYTLHVMDPDGGNLRAISAFENFEWTPSITNDGRILYARWDYVDRHNNAFMSLWATHPDGSFPNLVYGNFTRSPHCIFEARAVPDSGKFLFTASAHHAFTAGSICLLDVTRGTEGADALTRYTPEVCFPETEGWPATYYCNPYPLSEKYYLVCWSPNPIRREGGRNDTKDLGLYLADAFGNLELIYRDPDISSTFPLPLKVRPRPHRLPGLSLAPDNETLEGRFLILDVYRGLKGVPRGAVKRVRVIAVPGKTQPEMNRPPIGVTREDPGKVVLGTAPVDADGSAYLRVPAGVNVFLQALDAGGVALQTMRTITYVQPGQTLSCIGCHEPRTDAPPNARASAMKRSPSRLTVGPEGSWPLHYEKLVQPVLDRHCVKCHSPKGKVKACKKLDLTPARSYAALTARHRGLVTRDYNGGYSRISAGVAKSSPVLALLRKGHNKVKLDADAFERLVTWMDTYCQRQGHFSPEQERDIIELRRRSAALLIEREASPGRRGHIPAGGRERVAASR
ncbi:MAG: HzsA-related protein, partial [Planctomycetota bacterium]